MGVHFILYSNKAVFKVCTMSFAKSWCLYWERVLGLGPHGVSGALGSARRTPA